MEISLETTVSQLLLNNSSMKRLLSIVLLAFMVFGAWAQNYSEYIEDEPDFGSMTEEEHSMLMNALNRFHKLCDEIEGK